MSQAGPVPREEPRGASGSCRQTPGPSAEGLLPRAGSGTKETVAIRGGRSNMYSSLRRQTISTRNCTFCSPGTISVATSATDGEADRHRLVRQPWRVRWPSVARPTSIAASKTAVRRLLPPLFRLPYLGMAHAAPGRYEDMAEALTDRESAVRSRGARPRAKRSAAARCCASTHIHTTPPAGYLGHRDEVPNPTGAERYSPTCKLMQVTP